MPQAGLENAILATKRRQTYTLDRAATGISIDLFPFYLFIII
jgi:hypothetical protein